MEPYIDFAPIVPFAHRHLPCTYLTCCRAAQIRAGIFSASAFTVILVFNEYTRTSLLKGGFDTFTTVLISQMLNTGMSPQSYAMSALVSFIAIAAIGTIIIITLLRAESLSRVARAKSDPVMS